MSLPRSRWIRFRVLFSMQMARLRTSWRPYLIVSSVMPLGIAILLRAVIGRAELEKSADQIVAGCVVLAIAMTAIVMLAQRVAELRASGAFDYYATLPVSRTAVVGSVLLSFALFSLPGTVIVVLVGAWIFELSLAALWFVVPVWALGSFALAGLGVLLGLAAPNEQLAGMYSNLAMMAVLFLGILPSEDLPGWIAPLRYALPSTYAVEALKPGLAAEATTGIVRNLMLLAVFGGLSFWAVRGPVWPEND